MKTNWANARLCSGFVLALSVGFACDTPSDEPEGAYDNEFGVLLEGLGTNISDCTDAGDALSGTTLTLDLPSGEDAVISVVSTKLKVNGHQCLKSAAGGIELTSSSVTRLVINGAASGTNSVLIDLLPGSFGSIFGATGGITINAAGGSAVSLGVRGGDTVNNLKMAQEATGNDLFLELNGNAGADVRVVGDPSSVVFTLGGGADKFNAQDTTTLTFLGAPIAMRAVVSEPLTIYGGTGADTLEGGNGDDILDGGADNDRFETLAAGGDGADTYQGGAGSDTVDYSGRSAGVTVDIDPGHTNAFVEGASLHGKTLSVGLALRLTVGGGGTISYTSTGQTGIANILNELNAVGAFSAAAVASTDDRGRLVIEAKADGASIVIVSDDQNLIGGAGPSTPTRNDSPAHLRDADDGETGANEHDDVKSDVENIKGSAFDDVLTGSIEPNLIDGNGGADDLSGGPGGNCNGDRDSLNGGLGDDVFQMGPSSNCSDIVDGGAGNDTASYELRLSPLTISLDGAANDGSAEADNVKTTVERVLGGQGDDSITGGSSGDSLHGGPGDDTLKGGAGNDSLIGNTGSDSLFGDAGDDFFDEASAVDNHFIVSVSSFGGQDIVHGGAGANTCDFRRGGSAAATYSLCFSATVDRCPRATNDGLDGDDLTNCSHLIADGGADTVTGSDSDDIIEGGGGADVISGGAGNDTLFGDAGNDDLSGGAGNDTLDGGGDQVLVGNGGEGDDVCVSLNTGNTTCEL
jgi:Ca2+-binding RTX toxin-like protein